jgi:redox-sensitive bicupin YhaK (pirin superfamily)
MAAAREERYKRGMLTVRRASDRGHANHGWLDSHHTFSFADFHDPKQMGFRALRVINEDRVDPGAGFPTHSHRDMEILSYVLEGALEHKDSMGNGSVLRPGDVQRMSAGTGVRHSEYNGSKTDPVHFLQIWILPSRPGLAPGYEEKRFTEADRRATLRLVASSDGGGGSVTVHADVRLYATVLEAGEKVEHVVRPGRHAWVQVAKGKAKVGGTVLEAGDGASTSDAGSLTLEGLEHAEALLFDLA